MLDNSVSYFLSNYWRNAPLYAEKLIPLLDTCLSSNYALSDKISNAFFELINKYQNTAELPLENLKEFIREQGYGYILDLVIQDENSVKALWYLLVLIHNLKGSKQGILLVLSLFEDDFDPNKTKIEQWYETIPVGRENTFTLESTIDVSKMGDGFFKNFQTFISNYVYPEMLSLKVNYAVDGRITHRPFARTKISCSAIFNNLDTYNSGPASDFYQRDVYDGGPARNFTDEPKVHNLIVKGDLTSPDADLVVGNTFLYNKNTNEYTIENLDVIPQQYGDYVLTEIGATHEMNGTIYTHIVAEDVIRDMLTYENVILTLLGDVSDLEMYNKFKYNTDTKEYIKEDLTMKPAIYGDYMFINIQDAEEIDGILYTNVVAEKPVVGGWFY